MSSDRNLRHLPPLRAVRAFEAAARHLSFNRGAEELHVTPSAISHQIRSLEQFLGVFLFRRVKHRISLTAEGLSYLPKVQAILDELSAATADVCKERIDEPLTIGVARPFAKCWLVSRLYQFQDRYPETELRVTVTSETGTDAFARSELDLAIWHGSGEWKRLESLKLLADELSPVCSPHLIGHHSFLGRPADISKCTLLHLLPRAIEWRSWIDETGVTNTDSRRGPKFDDISLLIDAAVSGLGMAILNRHLVNDELRTGRLVAPFDHMLVRDEGYHLVFSKCAKRRTKVDAFIDWLMGALAAHL